MAKKSYAHSVIESGKLFAVNLFLKNDQEAMTPFTKGGSKRLDNMIFTLTLPHIGWSYTG